MAVEGLTDRSADQTLIQRALWAIDMQRGLRDLERGDVAEWDEVYDALRRELAR